MPCLLKGVVNIWSSTKMLLMLISTNSGIKVFMIFLKSSKSVFSNVTLSCFVKICSFSFFKNSDNDTLFLYFE